MTEIRNGVEIFHNISLVGLQNDVNEWFKSTEHFVLSYEKQFICDTNDYIILIWYTAKKPLNENEKYYGVKKALDDVDLTVDEDLVDGG